MLVTPARPSADPVEAPSALGRARPMLGEVLGRLVARPRWRAVSGFAGVGLAGVGVNQVVLTVLVQSGVAGYLVAAILATQAAILFNFSMLERWVFTQGGADRMGLRLARYSALSNVFLVLGIPLLALLVSGFGLHYALANLAVIGVQFSSRFIISQRLIWQAR
jgi:dolichol-phosphate mannosyltransferase